MSTARIDSLYSLFTGTPGTRKSTQALSYPGPQYWFSWDQKMESILLPMRKWSIDPKSISYDNYRDWSSARKKLESFLLTCPFQTIILDSITTLADSSLNQVRGLKTGDNKGKVIGDIAVNSIEDYNAESAALMEMIALTKQLHSNKKVNIILIAHLIQAEYKQNPNGTANIVRTIVTAGKRVAPKIPAYAGESYHFFLRPSISAAEGGKYSVLTTSTTEDFARTQLDLQSEIEFGDKQLYKEFILPAITKINQAQL